MAKISAILECLFADFPKELAEDYDNVGLLAGSKSWETDSAVVALDLTHGVIDDALRTGAKLIVTHHPILFRGRKNLCEDDPEGALLVRLVREKIALIAMHTNFDAAEDSVNDALAETLHIYNVEKFETGMRLGEIKPVTLAEFADFTEKTLGDKVRVYGKKDDIVSRAAVMGGSGGGYARDALSAGANVFITGEISYHNALDMYAAGMCVLEAGHAATERCALDKLAKHVKRAADINIEISKATLF